MTQTNNPYCLLSDVRSVLGIKTTADDVWLQSLIPQAQSVIDNVVGYSFQTDGSVASPVTRVYSGKNNTQLYTGYIQQIVQAFELSFSLGLSFDGHTTSSQTTLDITQDVVTGPENRNPGWVVERLSGNCFNSGTRNYKIIGVFGRSDIPADINRACARLASHFYKMRDTNYADVLVEQGGARQKYNKHIPDDVCDILDNYRLHFFYGA